MEVTVLEAQNTPKKPVIAVRAGSSLRHAEMVLNEPFKVPGSGQDRRIKVSLYEQLGTQTIPDADETESVCNVPVRTPNGACSQVKLRIRRGQQQVTGPQFKSSTKGVEDYLNTHQLEARIQGLFETVLKKQPADPYRCMIEELHKIKQAGEAAIADALPLADGPKVPVAPSGPPPANARPSPAGKARNLRPGESEKNEASETSPEVKAVLAEVMKQESSSLGNIRKAGRSDASKALSNLELAHEVMRLCIRQIVAKMAMQSASLGNARDNARALAVEHAKNRLISHHVIHMLLEGAHGRLEAAHLGLMGGGHDTSCFLNDTTPQRDWVQCAQDKALTEQVTKAAYSKASKLL